MSNKKITLAKIMPCGAQLIKTVKDWGDGQCLEQTKICKNFRQRLGRRSMPGADKDLQKFGCRNSII